MQVATDIVVDGKVVVEGLDLAEGETVTVLTQEDEAEIFLSPEDEAELLEEIAEADRCETIAEVIDTAFDSPRRPTPPSRSRYACR